MAGRSQLSVTWFKRSPDPAKPRVPAGRPHGFHAARTLSLRPAFEKSFRALVTVGRAARGALNVASGDRLPATRAADPADHSEVHGPNETRQQAAQVVLVCTSGADQEGMSCPLFTKRCCQTAQGVRFGPSMIAQLVPDVDVHHTADDETRYFLCLDAGK